MWETWEWLNFFKSTRKSAPQLLSARENFSRAQWRAKLGLTESSRPFRRISTPLTQTSGQNTMLESTVSQRGLRAVLVFDIQIQRISVSAKMLGLKCLPQNRSCGSLISGTFKASSSGIKICTNRFCITWNACWVILAPKSMADHRQLLHRKMPVIAELEMSMRSPF